MDLRAIFISNGIGVAVLLVLLYASRTATQRKRPEDRVYSILVYGVMLSCITETLSYWLDGKTFSGAVALNYIVNTYLFTANIFLPFCVLMYVDLGLYGNLSGIAKKYRFQIAVGAIMLAINAVNLFVPVTFFISEQNVYERRPFGYFYYFVVFYYCLTSMIVTRRFEKENGARAFFNIFIFLTPILAGTVLQLLFYGISLAWVASALALVVLFMMQQNEMAFVDALSDTYNRQYLNNILTVWAGRGKNFAGVMMDIDCFKSVNDNYGHTEGDKALRDVADILKRSRQDNELVFRFAGDEFIVLKLTDDVKEMESYMSCVERNLEQHNSGEKSYDISVSYGIAYYRSNGLDAFMKEMDDGMYAMKQKRHAAMKAREEA